MNELPEDSPPAYTPASISKAEINDLPLSWYDGEIDLVRTPDELDRALDHLGGEEILGFDTETRPSFRRGESYPPSLVQLAGESRVVIIQLQALGREWGALPGLFASGHVRKAGIAPRDDVKKLRGLFDFRPDGFHDLSEVARQAGFKQTGLRALAALVFGERVSKSEQVSNWSARELSRSQLLYAATDAWMTRRLYRRICEILADAPRQSDLPFEAPRAPTPGSP